MTAWKLRRDGVTLPKNANREGIAPALALDDNATADLSCLLSDSGSTGKIYHEHSILVDFVNITHRDERADVDISPSWVTRLVLPLHNMARQFPASVCTERQ